MSRGRAQGAEVTNLEQLIALIEASVKDSDTVSLRAVLAGFGARSFGPLLLLAGLITAAPVLGDVPGVPTLIGIFVVLTVFQILFHREHLWLPRWLLDRSVARDKVIKVLRWLRRPARLIDRLLKPRLTFMTHAAGSYLIAITCILIGLTLPVMEVIPLIANGAGVALTAFGLALIAHDGLVALLAFAVTAATVGGAVIAFL